MMFESSYIIIPLIIVGWFVTCKVASRSIKKTDRIKSIDKKDDLLEEIEKLATSHWQTKVEAELRPETDKSLVRKIESLRKIYAKLTAIHEDNSHESEVGELRKLITLDIEKSIKLTTEERTAKIKKIQSLVTNLEKFPPKF